jgi:ribosomal protein L37AE/L43A
VQERGTAGIAPTTATKGANRAHPGRIKPDEPPTERGAARQCRGTERGLAPRGQRGSPAVGGSAGADGAREEPMHERRNHYCCRCLQTTQFMVTEAIYTCSRCGVVIDNQQREQPRKLIGNPLRSYKTSFAA